MTIAEFSDEFDSLFMSYLRFRKFDDRQYYDSINLDEYEKSMFLTKAQEEIVKEFYNSGSFEETEEVRRALEALVKTTNISNDINSTSDSIEPVDGVSKIYQLPNDVWYIVYEAATLDDSSLGCKDGISASIIPVTHDDYYRAARDPFKRPNDIRVFRLDLTSNKVELISKYTIGNYFVRYVAKPTPIVLTNISPLTINGVSTATECMLNSAIHRLILDRAVYLAAVKYNLIPKSE